MIFERERIYSIITSSCMPDKGWLFIDNTHPAFVSNSDIIMILRNSFMHSVTSYQTSCFVTLDIL